MADKTPEQIASDNAWLDRRLGPSTPALRDLTQRLVLDGPWWLNVDAPNGRLCFERYSDLDDPGCDYLELYVWTATTRGGRRGIRSMELRESCLRARPSLADLPELLGLDGAL